MNIQLNYTPKESLQLIKEYYKEDWYKEVDDYVQMICGVAQTQKITIKNGFKVCLKLITNMHCVIRLEAAMKVLLSDELIDQEIKKLEYELQISANRSAFIETSNSTPFERGISREAVYRNIKTIERKLSRLRYAKNDPANIDFEGEIIKPDGSEEDL